MKRKRAENEDSSIALKNGSIYVKIYRTENRVYRKHPGTGEKQLKSEHPQFTVSYYEGAKRVLRKFVSHETGRNEGNLALNQLVNNHTAALKRIGDDRWKYSEANNKLGIVSFPDLKE